MFNGRFGLRFISTLIYTVFFVLSALTADACEVFLASQENIGEYFHSVTEKESSVAHMNYPLLSEGDKMLLWKQMQQDVQHKVIEPGFFAQYSISPKGILLVDKDETIEKSTGHEIREEWNSQNSIRAVLLRVYEKAKEVEELLRDIPQETQLFLSEVVLSYQYKKVPENWHQDWYEREYMVATQAVIARSIKDEEKHVDHLWGGTEYLLLDESSDNRHEIVFDINTETPQRNVLSGLRTKTSTGALAIHSGSRRVEAVLGAEKMYSGVSPLHRGSYEDIDYRLSILLRFESKSK